MVKVGLIKIERDGKGGNGIQKDTRNLQAGILHNSIYKKMSLHKEFTSRWVCKMNLPGKIYTIHLGGIYNHYFLAYLSYYLLGSKK